MTEHLIIGGGISGLYMAYKLNVKDIIIIEKSNRLGGRILTYENKGFKYESGAGRVGKKQNLIMELIEELGLKKKLIRTMNKKHYFLKNKYFKTEKKLLQFYKIKNFKSIMEIWQKILKETDKKKEDLLKNINLYTYLFTILKENEVELITDTMGYISELLDYNAYNAIYTLKNDFDLINNEFYILYGGLEQIIEKLKEILIKRGVKIFKEQYLIDFKETKNHKNYKKKALIQTYNGQKNIFCNNIYFTIKRSDYMEIKYFKKNISLFRSTVNGSNLMRIYAKYPSKNGKSWFSNIPKVITDNPILYIIPIVPSEGLIMISYSDKYFADFWNNLKDEKEIEKMLKKFLKRIFPNINIPKPNWITTHYWKNGVHYWKPKVNSEEILKELEDKYFKNNIFILGETYSNSQAWIEGGLKSVERVIIFKRKQIGGSKSNLKKYTLKEIKELNNDNPDQVWGIIKNKKNMKYEIDKYYVYNFTKWVKKHPGGSHNITKIKKLKNHDVTDLFHNNPSHGPNILIDILPKYIKGYLTYNYKGGNRKRQFWEMNIEDLKEYIQEQNHIYK
jgi:hypothetical protein